MDSPGVVIDSMCSHDLWSGAAQDSIGKNASICVDTTFLVRIPDKLVVFGMRALFPVRLTLVDVYNQEISIKCSIPDGQSQFYFCIDSRCGRFS